MEEIVETAYQDGKIPQECIEEVILNEEYAVKTVIFKEV